ncbi:MAG: stage II sporulation protein M [Halanaeroarchaeum sp.]
MRGLGIRTAVSAHRRELSLAVGITTLGYAAGLALFLFNGPSSAGRRVPRTAVFRQLDLSHLLVTNGGVVAILAGGGVLLGVPTAVVLFQNGLVLGLLTGSAHTGRELGVFLVLTLPHGILELTGFWLAATVGLSVPVNLARYLHGDRPTIVDPKELQQLGLLVLVAFLAIVTGALVESSFTAILARHL